MNAKPVEFHPEATSEAEDSVNWYRYRSERAAERFLRELEHAVEEIAEAPGRWPIIGPGARKYPLRRFPFLIIYRELSEVVQILAVAHGRRRPGYWRPRAD